jgi:hypothetical protein
MRTSLNNTRLIENYLDGKLSPGDRLVFEARLVLNRSLRMDLHFQKKTYVFVKMYHHKKLKEEMEALHCRIFGDPNESAFQQSIYRLFKPGNS